MIRLTDWDITAQHQLCNETVARGLSTPQYAHWHGSTWLQEVSRLTPHTQQLVLGLHFNAPSGIHFPDKHGAGARKTASIEGRITHEDILFQDFDHALADFLLELVRNDYLAKVGPRPRDKYFMSDYSTGEHTGTVTELRATRVPRPLQYLVS